MSPISKDEQFGNPWTALYLTFFPLSMDGQSGHPWRTLVFGCLFTESRVSLDNGHPWSAFFGLGKVSNIYGGAVWIPLKSTSCFTLSPLCMEGQFAYPLGRGLP